MLEHIQAVFVVERQDDLAVGVGLKGVALGFQFGFDGAEAVQLAVAGHAVRTAEEGLHALGRQAHNGETAKAQQAELSLGHTLVVRPAAGLGMPGPPLCVIARQRATTLRFCYGSALDHHNFPVGACKRGGVAGRHDGLVLAHAGQQVGLALVVQLAQNVIQQ